MRPENLMILSLSGIGLGISFAWWLSIRVTLFQADLLALLSDLEHAVEQGEVPRDRSFHALKLTIKSAIFAAPYLNLPSLIKLNKLQRERPDLFSQADRNRINSRTDWEELYAESSPRSRELTDRFFRILLLFLFSTPSNGFALLNLVVKGSIHDFLSAVVSLGHDTSSIESLAALRH